MLNNCSLHEVYTICDIMLTPMNHFRLNSDPPNRYYEEETFASNNRPQCTRRIFGSPIALT